MYFVVYLVVYVGNLASLRLADGWQGGARVGMCIVQGRHEGSGCLVHILLSNTRPYDHTLHACEYSFWCPMASCFLFKNVVRFKEVLWTWVF